MELRFGERISGLTADGTELHALVFNETEVRAAAGLTMVLGAVAFSYAYFAAEYVPLQIVSTLFLVEFLTRLTLGLGYSPMGAVARVMTRRHGQPGQRGCPMQTTCPYSHRVHRPALRRDELAAFHPRPHFRK